MKQKALTVKKRKLKYKSLYLLMLPTILYLIIFNYVPLGGLIMAFNEYTPIKGIFGSKWVGFKHFKDFLSMPDFWSIMRNTLVLSVYSIVVNTILPIILALFINEIHSKGYKKVVQTISYAPYFISVVVVVGMMFSFSDYDNGIVNRLIVALGGEKIHLMEDAGAFPHLYVWTGVWQGLGWWAIIYVGALSSVDTALHEAATIDGAGRLRRIWHINLPAIIPMALIMFIMSIGNMLSVGFEKVYLMQTAGNISVSNIISTYVYKITMDSRLPQYSYATAIGMFNSVINIILLAIANYLSKKFGETSLW